MAKGFYRVTPELQNKWYEAHRLSLTCGTYEPMWRVEDVKSHGVKAKLKHFKDFKRTVHLLSQNEVLMYMLIAWNPRIIRCYEQYALPLKTTLAIAKELGVKHPHYVRNHKTPEHLRKVKCPIVQTIDFFCELDDGSFMAYAVKQQDELFKRRSVEKLKIQEAWCEISEPPIKFELVDHTHLKVNRVQNLERIYRNRELAPAFGKVFSSWLSNFWSAISDDRHERLANLIEKAATVTGLSYSVAIQFFHHGLWSRQIHINWDLPLLMELTANDLEVCPYE
jgi:hypothetical protein